MMQVPISYFTPLPSNPGLVRRPNRRSLRLAVDGVLIHCCSTIEKLTVRRTVISLWHRQHSFRWCRFAEYDRYWIEKSNTCQMQVQAVWVNLLVGVKLMLVW